MIDVKLYGGPDDGEVQAVRINPVPGGIVSAVWFASRNGGIYRVAVCEGWPSRGTYCRPLSRLAELPSLGAPDFPDHGGSGSRSGAPSDDEDWWS